MTPDILRIVGEALYGPRWQSELASELGVSDRTIRRWVSGAVAIPGGIVVELIAICRHRGAALAVGCRRSPLPSTITTICRRRFIGSDEASAMVITLSHKQLKHADRAQGMELMVLWPDGLPLPLLAEDEDRPATDREWSAARRLMGIPRKGVTVLIRQVYAVMIRRPYELRLWPGEVAPHLAIELVTPRWYGATNTRQPVVKWHDDD